MEGEKRPMDTPTREMFERIVRVIEQEFDTDNDKVIDALANAILRYVRF